MNLTNTPEWQALLVHKARLQDSHLRDLFAEDPQRFKHFSLELDGLLVDYSKQRIDAAALKDLLALAEALRSRKLGVIACSLVRKLISAKTARSCIRHYAIPISHHFQMPKMM